MREIFDFLVDLGVVEESSSAITPAGRPAYGPGSHWQAAIVECDETFLEHEVNGVVGRIRRSIVDPGSFEAEAICPECLQARPFDEAWEARASDWVQHADQTDLECPHCGEITPVEDWAYDPPLGFGNLSVTFWNWPSINREFIHRVQRIVGTHASLIEGKGDSISNLTEPGETLIVIPPEPR